MQTKSINYEKSKDLQKKKVSILKRLLCFIKDIEKTGNKNYLFGKIYHKIFYTSMINKEIKLGNISENSKVLHIGSGPFPMTAIQLIEKNIKIDCVDNDLNAIECSKVLLKKIPNNHLVQIIHCDGKNIDYSKYDVIILSLHVTPKDIIIKNILNSVESGTAIVYRNPRSWLNKFYPKYYPKKGFGKIEKVRQTFGKESVVLYK
jgi:hypothetical protein